MLYLVVSFNCVFISLVDLIRVWNGPLPELICTPMQVIRLGIVMMGSLLLTVLSVMKTWIVCIRKSVPTMDDNFVVVFVTRASFMLSFLYSSVLVILPQKPALAHVSLLLHTIQKVKFLSKNSISTKPQHFHEFFTKKIFYNFLVKSMLSTVVVNS